MLAVTPSGRSVGMGRASRRGKPAGRRNTCVWVCRAVSAAAWGRCHLVCHWLQDIKSSLSPYLATVRALFEFRLAGGPKRPGRTGHVRRGGADFVPPLSHNWAVWSRDLVIGLAGFLRPQEVRRG